MQCSLPICISLEIKDITIESMVYQLVNFESDITGPHSKFSMITTFGYALKVKIHKSKKNMVSWCMLL